jgi:hypothetical protein
MNFGVREWAGPNVSRRPAAFVYCFDFNDLGFLAGSGVVWLVSVIRLYNTVTVLYCPDV